MTDDRTLERAARSWLEEGPVHAPDRPVEAALSAVEMTRQDRDLRVPWRMPTMNPMFRLAGAAVLVLAVSGAILFAMRPASDVGPPATPTPPASTAPQASAADPIAAYRTARNQICMAALQAFGDNDDLVGVYNPSTPPDLRAIVNANAQDIADALAVEARELAELQPPAELLEAHIADVARAQDQAAIAAATVQLLRDQRYADAAAQEVAAEAATNLRKPFETEYGLFNCR